MRLGGKRAAHFESDQRRGRGPAAFASLRGLVPISKLLASGCAASPGCTRCTERQMTRGRLDRTAGPPKTGSGRDRGGYLGQYKSEPSRVETQKSPPYGHDARAARSTRRGAGGRAAAVGDRGRSGAQRSRSTPELCAVGGGTWDTGRGRVWDVCGVRRVDSGPRTFCRPYSSTSGYDRSSPCVHGARASRGGGAAVGGGRDGAGGDGGCAGARGLHPSFALCMAGGGRWDTERARVCEVCGAPRVGRGLSLVRMLVPLAMQQLWVIRYACDRPEWACVVRGTRGGG